MNQVRNPVLISCALKRKFSRCMLISSTTISSGLRSSPTVDRQSLNIFVTLRFTFCFEILHLCCICLLYVPRLSYLLMCHNDGIDTGQNNRLFAPGIDMDRALLRLTHMQKGTYYVQICDKCCYKANTTKSAPR